MDEEIEKLCAVYGFSWDRIGKFIRIKSLRDTWYIEDKDYTWHKIELHHQNEKGKSYFHSHGKCNNLKDIFISMDMHDHHEELHIHNKLTRITNYYRQLDLCN